MAKKIAALLDRFQDPLQINLFLRSHLGPRGLSIESVEVLRVQPRPGSGVSGLYKVNITSAGQSQPLHYGITSEHLKPRHTYGLIPGLLVGQKVWIWKHPADPRLPGLSIATNIQSLKTLWPGIFYDHQNPALSMLVYRPLRRAVIQAGDGDWATYFKIMTPKRADRLAKVHAIVDASDTPAVRLLAQPVAGIVPLAQLHGQPLTQLLFNTPPEVLEQKIDPGMLIELLHNLPQKLATLPKRPSWTEGIETYAAAAAITLPEKARQITRLKDHIKTLLPKTDHGPIVATHGDFYESNIYLGTGHDGKYTVAGILDLDTMGPGYLVDDLACMLGHLSVLPSVHPQYRRIKPIIKQWWGSFAQSVDPEALKLRTAAVTLSLVAGTRSTLRAGWRARAIERLVEVEKILDHKKS